MSMELDLKKTTEFWINEKKKGENVTAVDRNEKESSKSNNETEKELYYNNVKQPAGKTYGPEDFKENEITEIIPGRAWVYPNALTAEECSNWVRLGEEAGFVSANAVKENIRNNSRTSHYNNADMSTQIQARMIPQLITTVENSEPGTKIVSIHENWKIARYEKGQSFPAHFDQDSFIILPPNKDGVKERQTSSHTVLLYLTKDFEGGATRFFPTGDYKNPDDAIDVRLPPGGMLIFQQFGLLHNGMEVTSGVKMIAQSGILRAQPNGLVKPAVFKWGPGLKFY